MLSVPSLVALLATVTSSVSAHGFVEEIIANGVHYPGANPDWVKQTKKPITAGWYAQNPRNEYVHAGYDSVNIACHDEATPGLASVPVKAGETIELYWNHWPRGHHGPMVNYLAAVDDFASATPAGLLFFKISEDGMHNYTQEDGLWATDDMIANNRTTSLTLPSNLAAGKYVLRHEIIALHFANERDGTQNFPQCINLEISGGGDARPTGIPATDFYTNDDPGIYINIHKHVDKYIIPGPPLWDGASSGPAPTPSGTAPAPSATGMPSPYGNGTDGGSASPSMKHQYASDDCDDDAQPTGGAASAGMTHKNTGAEDSHPAAVTQDAGAQETQPATAIKNASAQETEPTYDTKNTAVKSTSTASKRRKVKKALSGYSLRQLSAAVLRKVKYLTKAGKLHKRDFRV